jgi:hypothetical protein
MPATMSPTAGPVVQPLAHEPQLRRVVAHEHGGEGGAEAAAARIQLNWHGHHHPRPRGGPRSFRLRPARVDGVGEAAPDMKFYDTLPLPLDGNEIRPS